MIRAIVVDDERPSCEDLVMLLSKSGMVRVEGSFTESQEALEYLTNNKADAVFLDIEMPEIDGIELSNQILDLQGKIGIVFVTAFNQYAVEAFRLNALDFLMKPVEEERLRETLDRIVSEKNIPMQAGSVQVHCLGKFKVETESGDVKFRTEKAEELFALLLDQKGSFISRSRMIDSLWEDYDGERAIVHFDTTLHNVKKAFLSQGVKILIEYDKGSYRLDVNGINCDYFKLEKLATEKSAVTGANYQEYETAAGLYAGEYLSGKVSLWLEINRLRLKGYYIDLLLKLVNYFKIKGRYEKVIEWMKIGLLQEPLNREMNYRLIEALLLTGNRISAEQYYALYESGCGSKMKQNPDTAFLALFR